MPSKFKLNAIDSIGAGLFNEQSKAALRTDYDVVFIPYDQLRVAKDNTFSVTGIEELADLIECGGLQQNLVVSSESNDGKYDILAGQRRYLAIGLLLKKGNMTYERVPCVINDISRIDFGVAVPDEIKSLYVIASTNKYREMTDADRALLISQLSQVYDAVKAAGGDDTANVRRREYIAKEMNMSPRTVQDFLTVKKKLAPELNEMFESGKINLSTATTLSALPTNKQSELIELVHEGEEKNTPIELSLTAKNLTSKNKVSKKPKVYYENCIINKDDLSFIVGLPPALNNCLSTASHGLPVSSTTKQKMDVIKADILKQYAKLEKLLLKEIEKYENS